MDKGMMEEEEEGAMVMDEGDAQRRAGSSAHEILQGSRASVEEIVANMLSIKTLGHPKSLLRELVTQMLLHFITLRQVPSFLLSPFSLVRPLAR